MKLMNILFAGSTKMASNYAKRMLRLSARIFGEVARPTNEKSMKVVRLFSEKPVEQNREITDYYPRHVELDSLMKRLRYLGLFRYFVIYVLILELPPQYNFVSQSFHTRFTFVSTVTSEAIFINYLFIL